MEHRGARPLPVSRLLYGPCGTKTQTHTRPCPTARVLVDCPRDKWRCLGDARLRFLTEKLTASFLSRPKSRLRFCARVSGARPRVSVWARPGGPNHAPRVLQPGARVHGAAMQRARGARRGCCQRAGAASAAHRPPLGPGGQLQALGGVLADSPACLSRSACGDRILLPG